MIEEGKFNKGGRNDKPSLPRPVVLPKGQMTSSERLIRKYNMILLRGIAEKIDKQFMEDKG